MRIRCLRNLGRGLPALKEGQVAEVDEEVGRDLVAQGLAETLPTQKKSAPPAKAAEAPDRGDETPPVPPPAEGKRPKQ